MNYNSYPSIGVDTKIKIIQDVMSGHLGFDNVDYYGRALKVLSKDGKSFVPEFHISNLERKEVYYDDQKAPGGNVFFIEADEEHAAKVGGMFTAKIKIVFMLNLNKLTGYGPDKTYRADSEVQDHCYKLVKRIGALDITGVEKGLGNVLKGFDLTNIVKNDLQPYHTFSINGNINYMYNCIHGLIGSSDNGGEEPDSEEMPVINNESQGNYATAGYPYSLQIAATNNPTSYSVWNMPEGLTVDAETGLITGTLTETLGAISFSLMATNEHGTGSKLIFLTKVSNDVSLLVPPVNLTVLGYNPPLAGPSFMFGFEILPYTGHFERMEVFKDGELFRTFLDTLFPIGFGPQSDLTQSLEYGESYVFTLRLKNSVGQYSEFSEPLNVSIPMP